MLQNSIFHEVTNIDFEFFTEAQLGKLDIWIQICQKEKKEKKKEKKKMMIHTMGTCL